MLKQDEIAPFAAYRPSSEAPIVPMSSMEVATEVAEKFFETDTPKGILLVRGALGVGKSHFLLSCAERFNFRTGKVHVAKILPTARHLEADYSEYKGSVLVFIFSVEAIARRQERTIELWKKLLELDIAIVAEAFDETDVTGLHQEFGNQLTVANIEQPSKRDLALFALHYYSNRVPQGRPHLDVDFFRDLVSSTNSFRRIQAVILIEKIAFEKGIRLSRHY